MRWDSDRSNIVCDLEESTAHQKTASRTEMRDTGLDSPGGLAETRHLSPQEVALCQPDLLRKDPISGRLIRKFGPRRSDSEIDRLHWWGIGSRGTWE